MSARIRLYIAASLDGYIASPDGGVEWLAPYPAEDFDYAGFIAGIGTVVMGRATFDQIRGYGAWPYGGKRCIVMTSRPIDDPPPGTETATDAAALLPRLRAGQGGDVWLAGGARTARQFLDIGAVDAIELYVIPTMLGRGIALFAPSAVPAALTLQDVRSYPAGVVALTYAVG